MPIAAIGIGLGTAIAGSAAAGATLYGAHKTASAANHAAQLTAQAANYGADKQDAASQRAEAFQRQQAENVARQAEIDRRANYDQWAASQGQHNTVRAALGYPTASIPAYVPGLDPQFTGAPTGPAGPSGPPTQAPPGPAARPTPAPGSVTSYLQMPQPQQTLQMPAYQPYSVKSYLMRAR